MEQWYKENIEALRHKIIDEFSYLYNKYRKKNQSIYAMVLKLNRKATVAAMSVSTLESLKKQHYNLKWLPEEWTMSIVDGIFADDFLDDFTKKINEYYGDVIVPKIQSGANKEKEIEKIGRAHV